MYGKRKRSSKGSWGQRKRPRNQSGGGGFRGFVPEGQLSAARPDRRSFRPSVSPWDGRVNQADRVRIKIRTYLSTTFTSTTGAFGSGSVSLNGLAAPFGAITGTHTNPTINNLCTLYSRYRVTYARLTLNLSPESTTLTPVPMFVAMSAFDPTFNTVALSGFQQLTESRLGRFKICPTTAGYTGAPVTISIGASPAVVTGKSLVECKSSDMEGNVNESATYANPATLVRFYLAFQANDGATTTAISVDLVLTQWVELYQRANYA